MKCPFCNVDNLGTDDFCDNCGGYLRSSATAATVISSTISVAGVPVSGTPPTTASGTMSISSSLTPGGTLQAGRYVIKKVLGQGGMGAALLATDMHVAGKPVVIKELISDSTDPIKRQEDVRNFEREVETLAFIDHALVPKVTDHFQEGTHYFMVQEYVEGENLEDRMKRTKRPMAEQEALNSASQVLDILDYLSQQKPPIVHRDIKPANIIIGTKDKRAHLVDFGIARTDAARHAQRKQSSALGTPGYAPPEQYQGNADGRSDLYALAATLHHLLTNRDPRNHPPFAYPPVRKLNPQLSPGIERVLTRVLAMDISQRYQSAAEMKQDIDAILHRSRQPLPVRPPQSPPGRPPKRRKKRSASKKQPAGPQPPPGRPPKRSLLRLLPAIIVLFWRSFGLLVIPLSLIIVLIIAGIILSPIPTLPPPPGPTATSTSSLPDGIGVIKAPNGEYIGISDGTFAFDTGPDRPGADLKRQGAEKLKANDVSTALSLWREAITKDTNDAETLIYLEDQRVLTSGSPHISIVVGTMLTGDPNSISVGRENLQGAYVAQKEYNDASTLPGGVKVVLLIANSGGDKAYATMVAQQIARLAQKDKTIVGVMGWSLSAPSLSVVGALTAAKLPMVSTAAGDSLTGLSPYFFRVAAPAKVQARVAALYAEQTLHAKTAAVFIDKQNDYSGSLAEDFIKSFTGDGNTIVETENYTVGEAQTSSQHLQDELRDALSKHPDLIYFAGYPKDVTVLLTHLQPSDPPVLGGNALYELGGYTGVASAGLSHLHLTAQAYPDEWGALGLSAQNPAFFSEYPQDFGPQPPNVSPYGYTRADSGVLLSYDSMLALLHGSSIALGKKSSFVGSDLQQALIQIMGNKAFQGVSGQISFGSDGNPINKAITVVCVDKSGHFRLDVVLGQFLLGESIRTQFPASSVCS